MRWFVPLVLALGLAACKPTAGSHPVSPAFEPRLVAVSVANLDASVAFYRDVLGFVAGRTYEFPEQRMRIAFVAREGFELELIEWAEAVAYDAPVADNPSSRRGFNKVAFAAPDLAAASARAAAVGARFVNELKPSRRTGGCQFTLADPDGNWVQVVGACP